jgi:hypothetical protein
MYALSIDRKNDRRGKVIEVRKRGRTEKIRTKGTSRFLLKAVNYATLTLNINMLRN